MCPTAPCGQHRHLFTSQGCHMTSRLRILIADDDPAMCSLLQETLHSAGFDVLIASNGDELVRMAQEHAPNLLLIDLMMPVMDGYEAIRQLRNDTRTAHLPMIILTARSASSDVVTGFETGADDYIVKPYDTDVLLARIRSHLRRAAQRPVHNPLTGLPGNTLLQAELEHRLTNQQDFALLYVDLDNFKAFNDAYGFARGDRAIHLLADVLADVTTTADFVGHIGGDDFAIIHANADVEALCQALIKTFDERVSTLYDEVDLQRGYLQGIDRQGMPRRFGLLSLSIAIVRTHSRHFRSVEEISKVAAELKNKAKLIPGSSYVIDRRRERKSAPQRERRGQDNPAALIISRDANIRSVLATTLRAQGYHPLVAADIVAAHTLLARKSDPAVLLTDAAQEEALWELWRQFATPPPLIVLTNNSDSVAAAKASGAYACVPHTSDTSQMVDQITGLLAKLHH